MTIFRDDCERLAHDIICVVKYGSAGGRVSGVEMERVADMIRGKSLRPAVPTLPRAPVVSVPVLPRLAPAVPTLPKLPRVTT